MSDEEQMFEDAEAAAEETAENVAEAARNLFDEFFHHEQKAFEETGMALSSLIPPGFKEHGTEAAHEFVKGFRVLFNATVDVMQTASKEFDKGLSRVRPTGSDSDDRPSSTGANKVKVQVE